MITIRSSVPFLLLFFEILNYETQFYTLYSTAEIMKSFAFSEILLGYSRFLFHLEFQYFSNAHFIKMQYFFKVLKTNFEIQLFQYFQYCVYHCGVIAYRKISLFVTLVMSFYISNRDSLLSDISLFKGTQYNN